ncbi:baseplate J/gp47 family protein [Paenibacillus radicis (ex Gao et al. 2016)]|uniref:Phage tail protein n=1 Tax=Paenibacillus radicis (ex Gao et al. 2016) TaxID=1737354 RepID=A0A917M6B8_9BACL|nr:baseplate J/gp47 family protein [Paenibacillus radicis (ex Gao et al. 2016)]GGG81734.1 phage tail protein [Paenibacillus radicis (ex Gao et al. 2016)]
MYENQTYSAILQRMLERVPGDVDKREGSIIYDALAPAAAELAEVYSQLDVQLDLTFADTSSGEFLRRRALDYGVKWQEATRASRLGLFFDANNAPMAVQLGARFSLRDRNYKVKTQLSPGRYVLECETAGTAGNSDFGALLPIDYINGLARAELADVLIPGEDDETDDSLRARLLTQVQSPGTSGNKADYVKWALSVAGVGGVQVEPLWDGPGTVRVVLIDSEKLPASVQLVDSVQNFISPELGMGEGVAPIGAEVTVAPAEGVALRVTAKLVLDGSKPLGTVKEHFTRVMTDYLRSIAFTVDPSPKYVRIGSLLLDTPGVIDFTNLLVNGNATNVAIASSQVAVLNEVSLHE